MFPEEILGGISPYILMLKDVSDHNVDPYLILLNLDTDKVIGVEKQNAALCSPKNHQVFGRTLKENLLPTTF